MKRYIYTAITGIVFVSFIHGCSLANRYGKLSAEPARDYKTTVHALVENWQTYDVSYAGPAVDNPSAVMFDPKGNDRKLVTDKWITVRDKAELSVLINALQNNYDYHPVLWRVLGPDHQFYGYMYSAWEHVLIKVVDEKTLWVDDLPMPPFKKGPVK